MGITASEPKKIVLSSEKVMPSRKLIESITLINLCLAWTLVSLYSIAGQDARDDFTFVDESNDNYMSWAEASVEAYDIDPDNSEMLQEEIDSNSDTYRVIPSLCHVGVKPLT